MTKDKNLSNKILEILDQLKDGGKLLYTLADSNSFVQFEEVYKSMYIVINEVYNVTFNVKEYTNINFDIQCECIIGLLNRISIYYKSRSTRLLQKIEYELNPLLQEIRLHFYFWMFVYGNKEKERKYYKHEMKRMTSNKYIDESEINQSYKYELSVIVVGYNKLDYTKLCVDSLLKYIPTDINYELILFNHGSTDGTKEYFEQISPTKQVDVLINGGAGYLGNRIVEGKYILTISNDVLITENCIQNMINCMNSDKDIALVVPSTPNVSNLQSIESSYKDIDEMYLFAAKNNITNPYRWEQRTRLCNPIELRRSSASVSSKGIGYSGYFLSKDMQSFPDDKISLLLRRNGYKMMLAKDAYCYHFGSVTLKDEIAQKNTQEFYEKGRKEFKKAFGIDPWGTGVCWDPSLIKHLACNEGYHVDVLGINCGIGSNPLKIKESIKENVHNLDVTTYNVTDEASYIEDLKGVSDIAEYINTCENLSDIFRDKKFKYIVFESKFETYNNPLKILSDLKDRIDEGGVIAIKTLDMNLQMRIKKEYSNTIQSGEWIILKG